VEAVSGRRPRGTEQFVGDLAVLLAGQKRDLGGPFKLDPADVLDTGHRPGEDGFEFRLGETVGLVDVDRLVVPDTVLPPQHVLGRVWGRGVGATRERRADARGRERRHDDQHCQPDRPETHTHPRASDDKNPATTAPKNFFFETAICSYMKFNPDRTAVVVVDMQNGFCHPDGSLHAPGSESAIDPVVALVDRARENGAPVVFTRDVHPPEQFEDAHYYDEFERWGEHVLEGSWEAEIVGDLDVHETDHVVVKHTYDAFYRTDLEGHLESHGIEDLLVCGTLANVCVLHTAGSAGLRDYRPVLVEDAVGYIEDEHREDALEHADWLFGEVLAREEVTFASPVAVD
jgi:nicotinamidase-related amidase